MIWFLLQVFKWGCGLVAAGLMLLMLGWLFANLVDPGSWREFTQGMGTIGLPFLVFAILAASASWLDHWLFGRFRSLE